MICVCCVVCRFILGYLVFWFGLVLFRVFWVVLVVFGVGCFTVLVDCFIMVGWYAGTCGFGGWYLCFCLGLRVFYGLV